MAEISLYLILTIFFVLPLVFILYVILIGICASIVNGFDYIKYRSYYKILQQWYNAKAFVASHEKYNNKLTLVTRLAEEYISSGGIHAIPVETGNKYSSAVHQFNKNGTFSTKAPYFISRGSNKWLSSGKILLVQTLLTKSYGEGFKVSNYNISGIVKEIGYQILEYETDKYYPLPVGDIAEACRPKGNKKIKDRLMSIIKEKNNEAVICKHKISEKLSSKLISESTRKELQNNFEYLNQVISELELIKKLINRTTYELK